MSDTCIYCGGELIFRYIDGILKPIHLSGGCSSDRDLESGGRVEIGARYDLGLRDDFCHRTKCPRCGASVFFIRHNGGSVWVDPPLGPPWPKHACFDDGPAYRSVVKVAASSTARAPNAKLGVVYCVESRGTEETVLLVRRADGKSFRLRVSGNHLSLLGEVVGFSEGSQLITSSVPIHDKVRVLHLVEWTED